MFRNFGALNGGKVFRCIRISDQKLQGISGPVWETDCLFVVNGGRDPSHVYAPDEYIRPLRDPGEDAQDESKAWLPPVPSTTKEHA